MTDTGQAHYKCIYCKDTLVDTSSLYEWDLGDIHASESKVAENNVTDQHDKLPDILENVRLEDKTYKTDHNVTIPSIFDLIKDENKLDYPICENCVILLKSELNDELENLDIDLKQYQEYLDNKEQQVCESPDVEDMQSLLNKVKELNDEYQFLLSEIEHSKRTLASLEEKEKKSFEERNILRHQLRMKQEEAIALAKDEEHGRELLQIISTCNVFNLAFEIGFDDDGFGVINGCRLGLLEGIPVDWFEINLGIGYVALIMTSIAADIKMTYNRYNVCPLANYSYVEEKLSNAKIKKLPLYNSHRKIVFWNSDFDSGLVALLNCFKQFIVKVNSIDSQFKFPYTIDSHYLIDSTQSRYSLKYHGNKLDLWTKAFRLLLTNLKWSFAWLTAHVQ
ncbi:hypothetical protein GJ496_003130 [Pomphorhynchus laevis]|nr:hypothetical protein GJ496_003130 [Pomphorhynchus laevis]